MELKNREIFTENLSKRKGVNNQIDWKNSVGYKVKGIYDDIEFEVEIVDYADGYMWIKYLDKEPFKIATGDFQDCKIGKLLGKITNEFKVEINTTFKDDNRNITVVDRKYINSKNNRQLFKYYQYKCNVCGWQGDNRSWIMESNLLKGIGCSCCASQTVVEKINSIVAHKETHWMIPYFQGGYNEAKGYTPRSNKKLYFKCLDCDRVKDKEISINNLYTNHSIGCSCGDGMSYGHKYTYNLLEQLKLDFKQNNTLDWCKFYNIYKNKEATCFCVSLLLFTYLNVNPLYSLFSLHASDIRGRINFIPNKLSDCLSNSEADIKITKLELFLNISTCFPNILPFLLLFLDVSSLAL